MAYLTFGGVFQGWCKLPAAVMPGTRYAGVCLPHPSCSFPDSWSIVSSRCLSRIPSSLDSEIAGLAGYQERMILVGRLLTQGSWTQGSSQPKGEKLLPFNSLHNLKNK